MQAAQRSESDHAAWQDQLFRCLKANDVRQVPYVPDAGHSRVIALAQSDPAIAAYPCTTEEEGVAAVCGAWLGGQRAVLLMQSSGVGNCVNMLSLIGNCRIPFVTIVTMRGEWGEFNPWQVPMGRVTQQALEMMGVSVRRARLPEEIEEIADAALHDAFSGDQPVAILLSQSLLGRKKWIK